MPSFETKYVDKKCKGCNQMFEVQAYYQNTLYGEYCALCFPHYCVEHLDGTSRISTEEEKEKDLTYKDELQGITHRGKIRV